MEYPCYWFQFAENYRDVLSDCENDEIDIDMMSIIRSSHKLETIIQFQQALNVHCKHIEDVESFIHLEHIRDQVKEAIDNAYVLKKGVINSSIMNQGYTIMTLYNYLVDEASDKSFNINQLLFLFLIAQYVIDVYNHHLATGEPTILYTPKTNIPEMKDDLENQYQIDDIDNCPAYSDIAEFR